MSNENPGGGYPVGYARVSTLEQDEALQHDALIAAGLSASSWTRPQASLSTDQPSMRCSISSAPATASRYGDWIALEGPCVT